MTELKANEFDGAATRISRQFKAFLVYGPDRGLVSERAGRIANASGVDLKDAFSLVRLDSSDISSDPGRLADETQSFGLFGGDKLIWVKASGTEKALADSLSRLLSSPLEGCTLLIEAGELKKGAALRKAFETSAPGVAIPCYSDDARTLNGLIDEELGKHDLTISSTARHRLVDALGGDRLATRNELAKLGLYCRGAKSVDDQDVIDIVGDASAISVDDAIDAILSGDPDGFIHAIQKVISSKTPVFLVLQGCLRQFQYIDALRAEMDAKRQSSSAVMASMGRHLHFKRKPIIENALRIWNGPAIAAEMNRLQAAILQSRQRNNLEESVAMQTLLATTLRSSRK